MTTRVPNMSVVHLYILCNIQALNLILAWVSQFPAVQEYCNSRGNTAVNLFMVAEEWSWKHPGELQQATARSTWVAANTTKDREYSNRKEETGSTTNCLRGERKRAWSQLRGVWGTLNRRSSRRKRAWSQLRGVWGTLNRREWQQATT